MNFDMDVKYLILLTLMWTSSTGAASDVETAGLDLCKDFGMAFEHIFTVPGEAALLNCLLTNDYVFNVSHTSYNVTWYDLKTGFEVTEEEAGTVVKGTSLWFLKSTKEHQGKYLCVVRTPEKCYKQATVLQVDDPNSGECGRPQKAPQWMQASVVDNLACPLRDYTVGMESFSIQWYKGCEPIQEGPKFAFLDNKLILLVRNVSPMDLGLYTCRMTFVLNGITSEVAETIECVISEAISLKPQMIEPINEAIKVAPGSQFEKQCRVFVRGKGSSMVAVLWVFNDSLVSQNTSDRIHQKPQYQSDGLDGIWLNRTLLLSSVHQDDFNQNFTCVAFNDRGNILSYFSLQPADPDLLLPIGLSLTVVALLFIKGVFLYRVFKVELTLAFRTHCPFFYESTDGDGKLYDAYVVYPRFQGDTYSEAVEIFAEKTLPQVLEGRYGYKLFILGRDSLPGQAVVDVVEETLGRCRRLLLLYTSSSLCCPEAVEWVERQVGIHRALVEGSFKVALLELEEVNDPLSLPESIRLLRDSQGAVQAWEKRKRCWPKQPGRRDSRDAEAPLTFLNLPSRFWRDVRYNMPVRGKAKPHSKRSMLLTL